MVQFKEDGFYEINVDENKNRYQMIFKGAWNSPDEVPHYLEHIKKTVNMLKPGFQSYVEIVDDKPPKFSITKIHQESQQIQMEGGLGQTALYLVKGKILQKMTLSVVNKLSGLKDSKIFYDKDEAMAWLENGNDS